TMTQDEINREEAANPANWSEATDGLYFSKRDQRLWVRTRENATSWTFNFGHRNAALWLLVFIFLQALVCSVVSFIEVSQGPRGVWRFIGVVSAPLLFTVLTWIAIAKGPVASKKGSGKDG